jgi:hypothetical protein
MLAALDPFGVTAQTGYVPKWPASATAPAPIPGIGRSSGPAMSTTPVASLTSLHNPLTWFALLAALTFGLIGFSSTARLGKARARINIGKE